MAQVSKARQVAYDNGLNISVACAWAQYRLLVLLQALRGLVKRHDAFTAV